MLDGALQIQPFDPALHRRLAEIHETRGHWAPAVEARAAILALAPPDPVGARYRLALALSGAGQAQAARREVLLALQSAPLYAEALELLLRVRDQIEESASRSAPPPAAAEPAPAVR